MPLASRSPARLALTGALAAAALACAAAPAAAADRADLQTTHLISRSLDGGVPNGPSTNGVISGDRRWARVIAFESDASDIVAGDSNGLTDVFFIRRTGHYTNTGPGAGQPWVGASAQLASKGLGGQPANGRSFAPAVDGAFRAKPKCVAFLSEASNLVSGDTNGKVDAFVSRGPGRKLKRVSLPGGRQATGDTTHVAVSGNCSRIAFVTDGRVYVRYRTKRRKNRRTKYRALSAPGVHADPSFSTGLRNDLVFGAADGVYLSKNGTGRARLVAPGGRNPAYNDIKRQVVTYEIDRGGNAQIAFRDLGQPEHVVSKLGGSLGDGGSRNPVIGNSGYYIAFESEASNLGVNALARAGDFNNRTDAYLYTNVRDLTLVQSVLEKAVPLPGGGYNPSMSFYANYMLFDSPGPLGARTGPHQVYMRYLGPL